MHYKGYKIRIYPTKEQEILIRKHIGACRFIWNYMLNIQIEQKDKKEKHLSSFELGKIITNLKKEDNYFWLNEVSNISLQRTCANLENSYQYFFNRYSGFPRFKSKKTSKNTYPVRSNRTYFKDNKIKIEKIGFIKYKSDFVFQKNVKGILKNVYISFEDNKYYVSFSEECENQACQLTDKKMGIDLGIKEFAIVAIEDEKYVFHNINKTAKIRKIKNNIKHTQRIISRKYEYSKNKSKEYLKTNNIIKEEVKLSKMYKKIKNIRLNYLHQISHFLVSLNPSKIIMEDIDVTSLLKNKSLSKYIQEQCFYKFILLLKYKCNNKGIEFVQVDKFYPSSKTCSSCGTIKKNLKLSDRTYICSECGLVIDRDYNAAINLMRYEA